MTSREPRRQRTYFILLLVTAFALLTIDYHSDGSRSPLHPLEAAVAGVVGPGENAVSSLVRPITNQVHFGKQPSKVAELQKELDAAKSVAESSQLDHRRVEDLDKLMGWPPYYADRMLPALVVGSGDTLSSDQSVTINAGTRDGLHLNMTVVTGLGLIGNVVSVSTSTSTVQLLTDPTIHVAVRNERSNVTGLVSGLPDGNLALTQVSQTSDVLLGDYVVTKGSTDNQPYVPDVPVGVVISVQNTPGAATHTAVVRPFASFDELDLVAVIVPPTKPLHGHLYIPPVTSPPATSSAPPSPAVTIGASASVSASVTPSVTPAANTTLLHTTPPPHTPPPAISTQTSPTGTPSPKSTTKKPTAKPTTKKPTAKPTARKPTTKATRTTAPPHTTAPTRTTAAPPATTTSAAAPPPVTPSP